MGIFLLIVKIRRYMVIAPVQVIHIRSAQILSRSAQIAENNIAQTITGVLFSHIKMKTNHLLYQIIYGARFYFLCLIPRQMSDTTVISNDLNIVQANVNKSQNVSNSLLNDSELENCAFLLLTEPWSYMAKEAFSIPLYHSPCQLFFLSQIRRNLGQNKGCFQSMIWIHKDICY